MRRVLLSVVLFGLALVPQTVALSAPACGFTLGFQALQQQVPEAVGDCLENEHFNVENGNAEQRTTAWHGKGGLLVWRKADNWTAFTDGYWSWVNGPYGVMKRLNTERFDWEAGATPTPPSYTFVPKSGPDGRLDMQPVVASFAQMLEQRDIAGIRSRVSGTNWGVLYGRAPSSRSVGEFVGLFQKSFDSLEPSCLGYSVDGAVVRILFRGLSAVEHLSNTRISYLNITADQSLEYRIQSVEELVAQDAALAMQGRMTNIQGGPMPLLPCR